MMRSDLVLYLLTGVSLILLVLLTHWPWHRSKTATATTTPRSKREPKPFAGHTRKPDCELCEVTEDEAIKHLSRSPHWVWVAMDPVCKHNLATRSVRDQIFHDTSLNWDELRVLQTILETQPFEDMLSGWADEKLMSGFEFVGPC